MRPLFRKGHPSQEGLFQASKWISYRALLDSSEMESLFEILPPFALYNVSELINLDQALFSRQAFLKEYASFVQKLKQRQTSFLPKPLFSAAMSTTPEIFYTIDVKEKIILKLIRPAIQLSLFHFTCSKDRRSFHLMTCDRESVQWGVQFSYPYLHSNSKKGEVVEVMRDPSDVNISLFQALAKWMRRNSRPTSFLIEGKKVSIAARIGNRCMTWINSHPQLAQKGLIVV